MPCAGPGAGALRGLREAIERAGVMIVNRQRGVRVSLSRLEKFLKRVEAELRLPADSIEACLMTDAAIARLNQEYRKKQGPTDVLSFPANGVRRGYASRENRRARGHAGANKEGNGHLGDIAISARAARKNARRYGRPLEEEMKVLLLHGTLHLMGYDHESDDGEMERVEKRLRRKLGIEP